MSRDEISGEYVNLLPSNSPKDAYTKVMEIAQHQIKKDLNSQNPNVKKLALMLSDKLDRKVFIINTYL